MNERPKYKVAYQGEPGAYSEAALLNYFGPTVTALGKETFDEVFASVDSSESDYAFLPIENSTAGSIHRNYDLMREHSLFIIGETNLRVHHCLIACPHTRKEEIRVVKSHTQALEQCRGYLTRWTGITIEPVYDTAGAVKQLSEEKEQHTAAIAARRAAEIYGMEVLEEGIEDNQQNYTRFLILSRDPVLPDAEAKTSILVSLRHEPGSLFKALSVFALRDIDLLKLESRPLIGQPGEYLFYIDFAGSTNDLKVKHALGHLEEFAQMLRVLGSYPRDQFHV